jgi:hypothetical protein
MGTSRYIVLDLETYRTRDLGAITRITQEADGRKAPASASKVEKGLWGTMDARQGRIKEALSKTSTDVTLAEPICVCAHDGDKLLGFLTSDPFISPVPLPFRNFMWHTEREMLQNLRDCLDEWTSPETVWVGHNIEGFDLAVLLNRWRRYSITPPAEFPVFRHGRWRGRVYDTMQHIPCGGAGFVSLDDACAMYQVPMRETEWRGKVVDGSLVGEIYESGDILTILEYCGLGDVVSERLLYLTLTGGGMWGTYDRGIWDQVGEIRKASNLTEGEKATAIGQLFL